MGVFNCDENIWPEFVAELTQNRNIAVVSNSVISSFWQNGIMKRNKKLLIKK